MSWVCPKSGEAVKSDSHRHAIFRCSPCSATTIPPVMSFSPAVFRQAPPRIVSRTPPLETKLTAQFHVKDVAHFPHGASLALERRRRLQNPSQPPFCPVRSEEHTSELQSPCNLVCRLLLEKKKSV